MVKISNCLRVGVAFVSSFCLYMLLAGSTSWTELCAAIPVAVAVAGFAFVQRVRHDRRLRLAMPPARAALRTLLLLVTDTVRVGTVLVRSIVHPSSGTADWQPFQPGACTPLQAGRRSLVTLAASLAPNGFVLDIKPSTQPEAQEALLLHRLARADRSGDLEWPV